MQGLLSLQPTICLSGCSLKSAYPPPNRRQIKGEIGTNSHKGLFFGPNEKVDAPWVLDFGDEVHKIPHSKFSPFLWVMVVMEYLGIFWHSFSVSALYNICVFTRIITFVSSGQRIWSNPAVQQCSITYYDFFLFLISPFCSISTRIVKW